MSWFSEVFMMNKGKRIKKLEEKVEGLEEKVEGLEKSLTNFYTQYKDDTASLNDMISKLQKKSIDTAAQNNGDIDLKKFSLEIKKYIDDSIDTSGKNISAQISACERAQLSKSDVYRLIDERMSQSSAKNEKEKTPVKTADVDYDRINKMIAAAVAQNVNQAVAYSVNQAVSSTLSSAVNQAVTAAVMSACEPLVAQIRQVSEKNAGLETELARLREMIEALQHETLPPRSIPQPAAPKPAPAPVIEPRPVKKRPTPLITEDASAALDTIRTILGKVEKLEMQYQQLFGNSEDDQVYIHTVSKAKAKLEKLVEKMKKSPLSSGKTANELVKIMESTLVKNLASPKLYNIVDSFLIDCGFVKVELPVGKRLSDDDYRYISDMPLEIPVKDASKHRTIVEKKHDAYTLFYIDEDDGMLERIIAGDYVIGRYREE